MSAHFSATTGPLQSQKRGAPTSSVLQGNYGVDVKKTLKHLTANEFDFTDHELEAGFYLISKLNFTLVVGVDQNHQVSVRHRVFKVKNIFEPRGGDEKSP